MTMKRNKYKTLLVVFSGILFSFAFNANVSADFENTTKFSDPFARNNDEFQGGLRDDEGKFNPNGEGGGEEVGSKRNGSPGDAIGLIFGLGAIYGVYVYAGKRQRCKQ
jgi:hypothetical protein